jgi:hypothetical protein
MEQECAVDQAHGQDYKSNGVKSKRHGVSFPLRRRNNRDNKTVSSPAKEHEKPKPSLTLLCVEEGSWRTN